MSRNTPAMRRKKGSELFFCRTRSAPATDFHEKNSSDPFFLRVCSCAVLLGTWLALAAGCAGVKDFGPALSGFASPGQQRKEEALRQFDDKRQQAEFEAALASWERGDAKGCEAMLQKLLSRNPDHRDARLLMVDLCLAGRRSPEALDHMQQTLRAHPRDPQVHYAMALLLDFTNRRGEALAYYEQAAKWEPDNEVYAVGYHEALAAVRRPGQATADAKGPQLPSAPAAAETVSAERTGSAETAAGDATQALLQRAEQALRAQNPEAALACFRAAIAGNPQNPQIPVSAATTALRHNQPDLAIELAAAAEKRFPTSAALKRVLGASYYRLGEYRSAQVALQQALSLDKSSALAYFLMGCTLAKLGQPEAAEPNFRQAQALDSRYTLRR